MYRNALPFSRREAKTEKQTEQAAHQQKKGDRSVQFLDITNPGKISEKMVIRIQIKNNQNDCGSDQLRTDHYRDGSLYDRHLSHPLRLVCFSVWRKRV